MRGTGPTGALVVAAALAVLVLLVLGGLAARSGSYAPELPPAPPRSAPVPIGTAPPAETGPTSLPLPTPTAEPEPVNPVTGRVVLVLVLALGAAACVAGLWLLVRHRPRRRPRGPDADVLHSPGGEGAAAIPDAVADALVAVEQPDAREAVVQAWLRLGAAAAAAGTPARDAETATEYAERLATAHSLPPVSVHRLAALYREARFSGHPVRDAQRDQARAELTALRAALAASGHRA